MRVPSPAAAALIAAFGPEPCAGLCRRALKGRFLEVLGGVSEKRGTLFKGSLEGDSMLCGVYRGMPTLGNAHVSSL